MKNYITALFLTALLALSPLAPSPNTSFMSYDTADAQGSAMFIIGAGMMAASAQNNSGGQNYKRAFERCQRAVANAMPDAFDIDTTGAIRLDNLDLKEALKACRIKVTREIPLTEAQQAKADTDKTKSLLAALLLFLTISGVAAWIVGNITGVGEPSSSTHFKVARVGGWIAVIAFVLLLATIAWIVSGGGSLAF